MKTRLIGILLLIGMLCLLFVGCGEVKTVHCDRCGKEVSISADSPMSDDWILYCSECEAELGLDTIIEER